ncbi:Nitrilase family, member 2 [Seminavis robusta]|uniref:Nitrilase family, member 2 n=1 Tax=Seminavis robusta TaxID=568900 RepID=A0A9N8ERY0_9STRA|nr:Nitrilase family, member 2 [Seminavis robusta]|eukprot:Sro1484_g276440.1 Nitrilase family, member 2 (300) ;mRNA; f:5215-6114
MDPPGWYRGSHEDYYDNVEVLPQVKVEEGQEEEGIEVPVGEQAAEGEAAQQQPVHQPVPVADARGGDEFPLPQVAPQVQKVVQLEVPPVVQPAAVTTQRLELVALAEDLHYPMPQAPFPTKLNKLKSVKRAKDRDFEKGEVEMPHHYQLQPCDVICGNKKETLTHPGNERFKVLMELRLQQYNRCTARQDKSDIVKEIINAVRDYDGHFLRQTDEGRWVDVGNIKAREKCGHAIRDTLKRNRLKLLFGQESNRRGSTISHTSVSTVSTGNSSTTATAFARPRASSFSHQAIIRRRGIDP